MKRIWQTKRASPRRRRSRTHSTPAAVSDGNLGVRPRVSNLKNATPGQILEALPKLESAQEEIVDLKLVIMPCIHDAIAKGKKYAVEQYISCININIQDENGWTPLRFQSYRGKSANLYKENAINIFMHATNLPTGDQIHQFNQFQSKQKCRNKH